jgi:hypothetical protein
VALDALVARDARGLASAFAAGRLEARALDAIAATRP